MKKQIVLKTESIDEILSSPPLWIFRWGLAIPFFVLFLAFLSIYFIKYSDIISGKIIITNLNQNDAIHKKEKDLMVKLILPTLDISKVKLGQTVNIKLNEYPFNDYGIIEGIVDNISLDKSTNKYELRITLPRGLMTSHNKLIPSGNLMIGVGEVQTTSFSILDRMVNKINRNKDI